MSEQTPFEKRTREVLEESTTKLDGRTLSRLTQARHAALQKEPRRQWWRGWVPAGATAAAAVLAVMVWTGPVNDPGATQSAGGSAFEDIDLLADAPEFVGEADDVEFYVWAADELES
jgi:hypothetical protein